VDLESLNERQIEEMQMTAEIINAMAVADGFLNLDACLAKHPERKETYNRYASAALQAIHHVQGRSQNS
jgi:hypothetical protein